MASNSRENILKKIKQALAKPVPVPFPASEGNQNIFQPAPQELEVEFAENFTRLQGKFSFCADEKELVSQLQTLIALRKWTKIFSREPALESKLSAAGFTAEYSDDVAACDAAITGCESLIARTGSIILSSAQQKRPHNQCLRTGTYLYRLYKPACLRYFRRIAATAGRIW
jgi:L-lactate dehydrogenase complex protein LldG